MPGSNGTCADPVSALAETTCVDCDSALTEAESVTSADECSSVLSVAEGAPDATRAEVAAPSPPEAVEVGSLPCVPPGASRVWQHAQLGVAAMRQDGIADNSSSAYVLSSWRPPWATRGLVPAHNTSSFAPNLVEAPSPPPLEMGLGYTRIRPPPLGFKASPYPMARPSVPKRSSWVPGFEMPLPRPQPTSWTTYPRPLTSLPKKNPWVKSGGVLAPTPQARGAVLAPVPFSKSSAKPPCADMLPQASSRAVHMPGLCMNGDERSRILPIAMPSQQGSVRQSQVHERNWARVWPLWLEVRAELRAVSPLLQQSQHSVRQEDMEKALLGRISDVTALRYLSTVQQLLAFLGDAGISVTPLSAVQLVDAVFALRADPANKIHATNSLKAIRWLKKLLELPWETASPLLQIFDAPKDRQRRESLPLPPGFVVQLERLLRSSELAVQDRIFCGSVLLMISASLRFSDMLHVDWRTLSLDSFDLRGITYRSKTSCQGVPWAIACEGLLGQPLTQAATWPAIYLELLGAVWDEVYAVLGVGFVPDTLFFAWHQGEFSPLTYGKTLYRLRALLREFSPAESASCESYTLHSAKATFLAWMAEALISKDSRATPRICTLGMTPGRRWRCRGSSYARLDLVGSLPHPSGEGASGPSVASRLICRYQRLRKPLRVHVLCTLVTSKPQVVALSQQAR